LLLCRRSREHCSEGQRVVVEMVAAARVVEVRVVVEEEAVVKGVGED